LPRRSPVEASLMAPAWARPDGLSSARSPGYTTLGACAFGSSPRNCSRGVHDNRLLHHLLATPSILLC
jgi:hypothetical protein